jgi:hypothetical protein
MKETGLKDKHLPLTALGLAKLGIFKKKRLNYY